MNPKKRLKIVLDTNIILASAYHLSPYHVILENLIDDNFELFVTTEIMLEYEEKLSSKFNLLFAEKIICAINEIDNTNYIDIYFNLNLIINDADDNKLVDCAFACNADYIVTNDKHFNVLQTIDFPNIKVISIQEFVNILIA